MQEGRRKKKRVPSNTSATGPCAGPFTPLRQPSLTFHPPSLLRSPKIETRHRHTGRIASISRERRPSCLVRVRRILKQRALLINGHAIAAILRAAVRIGEVHVELLVRLQVPAQHVGDDERVVVLAIQQVRVPDILGANGIVAAAGARPGGEGLIGAGHVLWG